MRKWRDLYHPDILSDVRFGHWQCPFCDRLYPSSVGTRTYYTYSINTTNTSGTITCDIKICEDCNMTPLYINSLDQQIVLHKQLRKMAEKKNVLCLFKLLEFF